MIKTFKNTATRKVSQGQKPNRFKGLDFEKACNRLDSLVAANSLAEIPPFQSVGLHALKGGRKGQWAMTINGRWRLVFEWRADGAYNVEIIDYHKG
jgi:proteic killer suppression protein